MWRIRMVLQLPIAFWTYASVNEKESDGNSPLHIASVYADNMLCLFLEYSPDITVTDSKRRTPSQIATSGVDQKSPRITQE
jgi:ankyrin repeat protein